MPDYFSSLVRWVIRAHYCNFIFTHTETQNLFYFCCICWHPPSSSPESRWWSLLMPLSISCLCFSVSSLRAFLSLSSSSTFLSSSPSKSSILQGLSAPARGPESAILPGPPDVPPSSGTPEVMLSVWLWGNGPMSDCGGGRQWKRTDSLCGFYNL